MLFVAKLWLGECPYAEMLYFRLECVLYHCILEDIMFARLRSVDMLLCLVKGGFVSLRILPRCGC